MPHELSDLHHILPLLWPGEGGCTLIRIRLLEPLFKMLHTEVCVPSYLVNSELCTATSTPPPPSEGTL